MRRKQIQDNYCYNSSLPRITGYINGQGVGDVAKYKYGSYFMAYNGCGIIASYNALIALGAPRDLNDVANWGESHGSVFRGAFGTRPKSARLLFEHLGYRVKKLNPWKRRKFDPEAKAADACIFTYLWRSKRFPFVGAHTVYVKANENTFEVYNESNIAPTATPEESFSAWIKKKKLIPIALYCIYKREKESGEHNGETGA